MDLSKYKNADLIRKAMRKSKEPPRSLLIPPGAWFQAFLAVILMPLWLPPLSRMLGCPDFAKRVISGCAKCSKRRNMMNHYGWRGLPRLLLSREFWRDSRRKEDVAWQKKTESASPTTITS